MNIYKISLLLFLAIIIISSFITKNDPNESLRKGEKIYKSNCMSCHMEDGKGLPGAFPPLAGSDYMLSDPKRAITTIKKGLNGKIIVNGREYNGAMPAFQFLSDEQLADLTNYIFNSWGNQGKLIGQQEVKEALLE